MRTGFNVEVSARPRDCVNYHTKSKRSPTNTFLQRIPAHQPTKATTKSFVKLSARLRDRVKCVPASMLKCQRDRATALITTQSRKGARRTRFFNGYQHTSRQRRQPIQFNPTLQRTDSLPKTPGFCVAKMLQGLLTPFGAGRLRSSLRSCSTKDGKVDHDTSAFS
jgi:hypothetical protein